MLDPLEATRAGDPDFDYLLGVAAIDSGKLTRGVFALERVLAVKPDYPQARAEIARAYFLMGENRAAREEFEAVKAAHPPAAVANTVDRFLSVLDAREVAKGGSSLSGYIELGYGQDSNANAATNAGTFAIRFHGGVTFAVSPNGGQTRTWYNSIAGGLAGRYKINDQWALVGSGSYSQTYNESFHQFDLGSYGGDAGVAWHKDDNEIVGLLQDQQTTVGLQHVPPRQRRHAAMAPQSQRRQPDDRFTAREAHLEYPGQRQRDTIRSV